MKYTIGTDDMFAAMHLIALSECFDHKLSYATMPALGAVTTLVELSGAEFARITKEGATIDDEPLFDGAGKNSPTYGALVDLQNALRRTEAQLSQLIDTGLRVK